MCEQSLLQSNCVHPFVTRESELLHSRHVELGISEFETGAVLASK